MLQAMGMTLNVELMLAIAPSTPMTVKTPLTLLEIFISVSASARKMLLSSFSSIGLKNSSLVRRNSSETKHGPPSPVSHSTVLTSTESVPAGLENRPLVYINLLRFASGSYRSGCLATSDACKQSVNLSRQNRSAVDLALPAKVSTA